MKFRRTSDDEGEIIPTASMADITFLLIIFFMVGTVFNVEKGIEMRLPQSMIQQDISQENVIISIDTDEKLYLDGDPVEIGEIGRLTRDKVTVDPDRFILIKSDRGVRYRVVIDILDELLQVGITNIALPTEEETP